MKSADSYVGKSMCQVYGCKREADFRCESGFYYCRYHVQFKHGEAVTFYDGNKLRTVHVPHKLKRLKHVRVIDIPQSLAAFLMG